LKNVRRVSGGSGDVNDLNRNSWRLDRDVQDVQNLRLMTTHDSFQKYMYISESNENRGILKARMKVCIAYTSSVNSPEV